MYSLLIDKYQFKLLIALRYINAVDAAGVEDVLSNQRGNIIRMIREAANENGERFLETVDTQTYGSSV